MQLMPATAAQIASEIGYPPNYTQADLSVPLYNLELGSNYLARQFYVFEGGDPYHALAAYNGGPGNTFIWKTHRWRPGRLPQQHPLPRNPHLPAPDRGNLPHLFLDLRDGLSPTSTFACGLLSTRLKLI